MGYICYNKRKVKTEGRGEALKLFDKSKTFLGLAPMAGFTDYAFRKICAMCGADFTVTEMISAKGLYYNNERTGSLMSICRESGVGVQIFGSEERSLNYAASYVAKEAAPDFIDINMGCPTPKIVNSGDGSALLKDLDKALCCARAVISGAGDVPVTVKLRLGWESALSELPDFVKRLEDEGIAAVFVHGRTSRQMYRPGVDYGAIKRIKERVNIPVFANGDITSPEKAKEVLSITGADGLLIGRGSLGNPFIFGQIKEYLQSGSYRTPTKEEITELAIAQLAEAVKDKGDRRASVEARSQIAHYLKGMSGAAEKRKMLSEATSSDEIINILKL